MLQKKLGKIPNVHYSITVGSRSHEFIAMFSREYTDLQNTYEQNVSVKKQIDNILVYV